MLALFSLAFAQSPMIMSPSDTEVVYVVATEGVAVKRFFDDAEPGAKILANGVALTVLFRESGWIRVRQGETYGWIPESAISKDPPLPTLPE